MKQEANVFDVSSYSYLSLYKKDVATCAVELRHRPSPREYREIPADQACQRPSSFTHSFHELLIPSMWSYMNTLIQKHHIDRPSLIQPALSLLLFLSHPIHFTKNSSEALRRVVHRHGPSSTRCHSWRQWHMFQPKGHRGPPSIRGL